MQHGGLLKSPPPHNSFLESREGHGLIVVYFTIPIVIHAIPALSMSRFPRNSNQTRKLARLCRGFTAAWQTANT